MTSGRLYDRADRMTGVRQGAIGSATVLANLGYYAMGQLASVVRGGGDSTSYQYTWGLQRPELIRDTFTAGTGGVDSTFAYNPASQIATRSRSNDLYVWTRARSMNRAYNPNGQNQYAHVGAAPFQSDANGNLSDDGQSIYVYDVENRLVSATPKGGAPVTAPKGQLRYDPLGRLYETSGGALGSTRYLYDGDELVAEYDGTTGALRHRYVHGAAVDDPLIWYEGADLTRRRAYHADHQGSIVAIAGAAGETLAVQTYDPWGVPGASLSGRFAYTGQIFIPELDMYHYKARLYSPTLGRFMQVDPIGYEGGQNLYAYVENDPVNDEDPSGLSPRWRKVMRDLEADGSLPPGSLKKAERTHSDNVNGIITGASSGGFALGGRALLAAGLSAARAKAGAFFAQRAASKVALRPEPAAMVQKILNIGRNNAELKDFLGAAKEANGVKTGFNHVKEMTQSIRGLTKASETLDTWISDARTSGEVRSALTTVKNYADELAETMRRTLR